MSETPAAGVAAAPAPSSSPSFDTPLAVSFDFGQTLAELDSAMLARRLGERGAVVTAAALDAALPRAWRAYDAAVQTGVSGHPWKLLVHTLLEGAGLGAAGPLDAHVDWLWDQQPAQNLWRRALPGMIELVDELRAAGVPVGVVSNSEGKLAELVEEMGWSGRFVCIADSGHLGIEKPGRAIFAWAAERLGVPLERIVHVGDSHAADVAGALAAGMHAVWFGPHAVGARAEALPARARAAGDAAALRGLLRAWRLLP